MEKSPLPSIVISIRSSIYALVSGGIKPDTMWRALLGLAFVMSLITGVLAFLSYQWASTVPAPGLTKKSNESSLSLEEIRALANHYAQKKRTFQELMTTRPQAPSLSKNTGVDASTLNTNIQRGTIDVTGGKPQVLPPTP